MSIPVVIEEWPELDFLSNEVTSIWFAKKLFDGLYFNGEQTIEIMNQGAKEFFVSLQSTLPMGLIRSLAAIYDKPKTGFSANVTIEGLLTQSRMWCSDETYAECLRIYDSKSTAIGNLRKFRNKNLAHNARETAVDGKIYGVKYSEINDLAKLAADIINHIQSNLFQSHTAFDQPIAHFPEDILNCVKVTLWNRELSRLIQGNHATESEVGSFIKHGTWSFEWKTWCHSKGVDSNYYLEASEPPESIS